MKLCFIGGGNPLTGELNDVIKFLSHHVKKDSKLLIIPFATEEKRLNSWYNSAKKTFESIGVSHLDILNRGLTSQEMQSKIKEHEVLYFTGGRPEKLMERLIDKELVSSIKGHSGLLVGVSAGALAFCKDCIITKDEDYPETLVIKGLDLVDFSVEVHYRDRTDEELIHLSEKRDIYAMPNGSGLFWDGEVMTPIKSIIHFQKGNKKVID
ncbi:Type 1 glutamine amidotransferase-like domain-containing protein [Ornithinibacillus sp. BX22]|uniref:Type 1 glutamine amidotransferase-like domain-containing protein n=1 Tax=Ornithinibacillus hominis TaxID=2763055 RepID=A0A923L5J3_9BACI|nr:Type 1 glutamine amidotransferase-like domain-containing protein [Ornithinibacillus hominis]MBC5636775.1 Type 1 glutamine amidotransferase-like domain-containing protein [Ornithinibacillus hominis]